MFDIPSFCRSVHSNVDSLAHGKTLGSRKEDLPPTIQVNLGQGCASGNFVEELPNPAFTAALRPVVSSGMDSSVGRGSEDEEASASSLN